MIFFTEQRGSAILELAVVIPFILLLSFMGLELGRGLEIHQAMNVLSKELANAMYRDCAPYGAVVGDLEMLQKLQTCVYNSVEQFKPQVENVLPGAVLVGSVYRKKKPWLGGQGNRRSSFRRIAAISTDGSLKDANATRTNIRKTLNRFWVDDAVIPYPRVTTVGEVFYAYKPMVPFYSVFSGDKKLYSVTIF